MGQGIRLRHEVNIVQSGASLKRRVLGERGMSEGWAIYSQELERL